MSGIAAVFLTLLLATACGREAPAPPAAAGARLVERSHDSMGAVAELTAWTADGAGAEAAFELVFQEFERLEAAMSTWRRASDVSRLNAAAGREPVAVSPDVFEALRAAQEVSELTGGAFDVTFGALSGLWKFDHDQDDRIPVAADIRARLPLVDYRGLLLDPATQTALLTRPGVQAHLGGIGKGYAVDRAAAILRKRGLRDFMIQFGGDLYVAGTRGGRPWRLGIRDPRGPADRTFAAIDLTDSAFSTSGDYERYFERNGRRYHHILDPRTGEPARGTRSVTIVAPTAAEADALSTGVFVLGPARGMSLVERLPAVEAVIVSENNQVLVSSGLMGRLVLVGRPTK
jgi:thiamine biosynthesis lipoprotein